MHLLHDEHGLKLILKYGKPYIRFFDEACCETCDLQITNDEKEQILRHILPIKYILTQNQKYISNHFSYYLDSGIMDYMSYSCNMKHQRIDENIHKLNQYPDIKAELYHTLINEKFPSLSEAIHVHGYCAESLVVETKLNILGAYNLLIHLREEEELKIKS